MLSSIALDRGECNPCHDSPRDAPIESRLSPEVLAYEEIVSRHSPRMLSVAKRILKCPIDAEDAVQQAFLSAFSSLDGFENRSCMATWLHRIVVNVCLMRLRQRRRRPESLIDDLMPRFTSDEAHLDPVCDWSQTALEQMTREETRQQVRDALHELPEHYRQVVQLRDIDGFDTAETAALLDVGASVVKTRLHRARLALREIMSGLFI